MKKYTQIELNEILEKHMTWIGNGEGGKRADLSNTDLRYADLSGANLSDTNLINANLSNTDLSGANLSGANLSNTATKKRYILLSCIGSRKGITTYCFDDDVIWCGCFRGTLAEFEAKVKQTHANNKQYLAEYLGAIEYIRKLKEV